MTNAIMLSYLLGNCARESSVMVFEGRHNGKFEAYAA
jgi:hypothetical protein